MSHIIAPSTISTQAPEVVQACLILLASASAQQEQQTESVMRPLSQQTQAPQLTRQKSQQVCLEWILMYGQVHANHVLYKAGTAKPGDKYRQIVVIEMKQFQVHILEGEVIQTEPAFIADNPDAVIYTHFTLPAALEDAEKEFQKSVAAGWIPH